MTSRLPMTTVRTRRVSVRRIVGSVGTPGRRRGGGATTVQRCGNGSAAVALLVLQARPAPARVIATDAGTRWREARLGLAGRSVAATLAQRLGHRIRGEPACDRRCWAGAAAGSSGIAS